MAKSLLSISRLTNTSPLLSPLPKPQTHRHAQNLAFISNSSSKPQASSSDRVEFSQNLKKNARKVPRPRRRLIRISTMDGRWHGQWTSDYVVSLRELQLGDLAEDGQKDAEVLVSLSVQKHAGFGFSVDGRIVTSLTRKCSICFSSYCREINTTFNVWVLPYSRSNVDQIPEIGGNDSSVIYVKPGCEADLDSLIRDTIRLTASAKADTCSELCEKSTPRWHYVDGKDTYDRRWSRLLEIKKAL